MMSMKNSTLAEGKVSILKSLSRRPPKGIIAAKERTTLIIHAIRSNEITK